MLKKVGFLAVLVASVASAQVLTPQTGVANDHGGVKTRSVDVAFVPRSGETSYGYNDGYTGVGLTILAWPIPNPDYDVAGFRLNLGWASYRDTIGFDCGTFSASRNAEGLQINLFGNLAYCDASGWQNGLVNIGKQNMRGLQIGLVNYSDYLQGVQIGLLNINRSGITFPILNLGW